MRSIIEHQTNTNVKVSSEELSAAEQLSVDEESQTGAAENHYSFMTLAALFLIMSMFGWCLEILYYLVFFGSLINPGVLHGPWVPLYGVGGVSILVLLKDWKKSPAATFLLIIILCGVVEFATGFVLESITGAKWWNYSNFALNIEGYVCLEALLAFGLIGMLFVYVIAPAFNRRFSSIPDQVKKTVLGILFSLFLLDMVTSFVSPNYAAVELNRLAVAAPEQATQDLQSAGSNASVNLSADASANSSSEGTDSN